MDVLANPPNADSTHWWTLPLLLLLIALVLQRLLELRLAERNRDALLARGGRVVEDDKHGGLVLVHTAFFAAIAFEWFLAPWAGAHAFTIPLLFAFAFAQGFRHWAISALGVHWTTRIVVVPGAGLVRSGPYRWLKHPNYVAVSLELLVLPLAFGCVATAVGIGLANAWALGRRIRREEAALEEATGSVLPSPAAVRRGAAG